ncbi:Acyltransferase family protein [Dyadobacter soli]|uniref:Acyltransferase family protein n=1 Tax=Dyadobacter soli TaxID=659014 RepID=A0A1G6ZXD9_9BACT|nr:acyltransferase [Dyadobacter soli]SDE07328.1 Acyltransferase family protein [Dyadobacter soli]
MPQVPSRTLWIDYLRSFLTVLVVAHHSSLAYTTFARFDKVAYIRSTHPIVDNRCWIGLDIFENFNDVFFMSLMFLIAGLFVIKSIQRKGPGAFVRDRFYRLFIPFLIGGTILNLIAHYPAYLIAHGSAHLPAYIKDFFVVEQWPVGPPWFIWVLFTFNVIFALIYAVFAKKVSTPAGLPSPAYASPIKSAEEMASPAYAAADANLHPHARRPSGPSRTILLWFGFTFMLYVPFAFWLGPGKWTGFGPFDFQVSRAAWYFGYFLLGIWLGKVHFNEGIFAISAPLVRRWPLWLLMCAGAYTSLTITPPLLTDLVKQGSLSEFAGYLLYFSNYVLSATFSCIAFMTTFRALFKKPHAVWDSLSENAYLIYLLHYPFVIWTQYLLLGAQLPAFAKFVITFSATLLGSWLIAIPLRKIDPVRKYI